MKRYKKEKKRKKSFKKLSLASRRKRLIKGTVSKFNQAIGKSLEECLKTLGEDINDLYNTYSKALFGFVWSGGNQGGVYTYRGTPVLAIIYPSLYIKDSKKAGQGIFQIKKLV